MSEESVIAVPLADVQRLYRFIIEHPECEEPEARAGLGMNDVPDDQWEALLTCVEFTADKAPWLFIPAELAMRAERARRN